MKELTFKNEKFHLTIVLRVNDDNKVISSLITFDESIELSAIFPSRGILLGMNKRPVSEPPRPLGHNQPCDQELPNWLVSGIKRSKEEKWKR